MKYVVWLWHVFMGAIVGVLFSAIVLACSAFWFLSSYRKIEDIEVD